METRRVSELVLVTLFIFLEIYSSYCDEDCFNIDRCECRKDYPRCTNAMEGYSCPATKDLCKNLKFKKGQCRRKNTYISFKAALCKIKVDKGDCKPEKVTMGVNCGGPEFTDSNGITYKAYKKAPAVVPDEKDVIFEEKGAKDLEFSGAPEEDRPLYETFIRGDAYKVKAPWRWEKCADWWIEFKEPGTYELTVKTFESKYSEALKRSFTITLNSQWVVVDMDIFAWTKKKGSAMDIILPFTISEDLKSITLNGYKPRDLYDKKARLGFCHGMCDTGDTDYVVSAFSIAKVKISNEDEEDWETTNAGAKNDESPSAKDGGKGGGVGKPGDPCFNDNKCECRKTFPKCTTAMEGYSCPTRNDICKSLKFKKGQCRRKNTYFSFRGALCKIKVNKGDCKPESVTMGVNCGGPEHTDSNGITYLAYDVARASLPGEKDVIVEEKEIEEFSGAPEEDRPLYETYIWGNGDKVKHPKKNQSCAVWSIPLKEPGTHRLTIKMLEPIHSEALKRSFTITFDHKIVSQETDIFSLTEKKGAVLDIILPIKVSKDLNKVIVNGYEPTTLSNKMGRLAFCHGDCHEKGGDVNYVVSAFFVAKMKMSNDDEEGWLETNAGAKDDDSSGGKDGGKGGGKVKPWPAGTNKEKGIPDDGVELVDCDDQGYEIINDGKAVSTKKPGTTKQPGKKTTTKKPDVDDNGGEELFEECEETTTVKKTTTTEEPDDGPIGGRSFG